MRKCVPAELRRIVDKTELLRSLQTGDWTIATRAYPSVWREFEKIVADARAGKAAEDASRQIDITEIDRALARWMLAEYEKPMPAADDLVTSWQVQRDIDLLGDAMTQPDAWRSLPGLDARIAGMLASR